MLNTVRREDGEPAIVHVDGHCDHEGALRKANALGDVLAHPGVRQRLLDLGQGLLEEGRVPLERGVLELDLLGPRHGRSVDGNERRAASRTALLASSAQR